ncbi:MAG: DUF488 family protein [Myxococcaceae bacterium]|nr:DUF488 family protein [Myxococcaceae bacterium]
MIRVVRLGTPRVRGEGVRIGTVRRPPRGVPKSRHAKDDWYDVWLPELSPSGPLVAKWLAATTDGERARCARQFERELASPASARLLELLVAMSRGANLAIGCYCADESKCHRGVLGAELRARGAEVTS